MKHESEQAHPRKNTERSQRIPPSLSQTQQLQLPRAFRSRSRQDTPMPVVISFATRSLPANQPLTLARKM